MESTTTTTPNNPQTFGTNNQTSHSNQNRSQRAVVAGVSSTVSTQCINNQQWTKFHSKQGHGFAVEDANALWDILHGHSVDKVGLNNALNGPDRICDGVQIQTKYCSTASKSVNAAFDNGTYRYDGMKIEVPCDQYDESIRLMRDKISRGQVPGVTDPNKASSLIVKGHYTYDEAVRIAKAGNLDSIRFDVQTQSVACAFSCGFSFAVTFLTAKSNGMSHADALKQASAQAVKSGVMTMATGVAAQQLLRTQVGRNLAAAATSALKPVVQSAMKTELGRQAVTKTAAVIAGKQVAAPAAVNIVTKSLRTNAVVSGVVLVGTTIPDAVDFCRGKIDGGTFAKKTATNAAGVGGGWAGAAAGAAVGSAICPGFGTVIGGVLGGIGASAGIKKVLDWF